MPDRLWTVAALPSWSALLLAPNASLALSLQKSGFPAIPRYSCNQQPVSILTAALFWRLLFRRCNLWYYLVCIWVIDNLLLSLLNRLEHQRFAFLSSTHSAEQMKPANSTQVRQSVARAYTSVLYAPTPRFSFLESLSALKASVIPRIASGGACA